MYQISISHNTITNVPETFSKSARYLAQMCWKLFHKSVKNLSHTNLQETFPQKCQISMAQQCARNFPKKATDILHKCADNLPTKVPDILHKCAENFNSKVPDISHKCAENFTTKIQISHTNVLKTFPQKYQIFNTNVPETFQ